MVLNVLLDGFSSALNERGNLIFLDLALIAVTFLSSVGILVEIILISAQKNPAIPKTFDIVLNISSLLMGFFLLTLYIYWLGILIALYFAGLNFYNIRNLIWKYKTSKNGNA